MAHHDDGMIVLTEQRGTEEWRRAHRCRVTASDADAALARRGTKKYAALVERLVLDFDGVGDETEEFPTKWQQEHELYLKAGLSEYRRRFGDAALVEVGLVACDVVPNMTWLAASPHALSGVSGALHFRVHRSLRRFNFQAAANRALVARLQVTMLVCERLWVDVVDYWDGEGMAPNKLRVAARVDYDYEWLSANVLPRLVTLWGDVSAARRARREVSSSFGRAGAPLSRGLRDA